MLRRLVLLSFLLLVLHTQAPAQVSLTQGTNISVDVSSDGRIAFDLLGGIWLLPEGKSVATSLDLGVLSARHPRWSPDDSQLVFQAQTLGREQLWLYALADGGLRQLGNGELVDQDANWHPDGRRLVYASMQDESGFDLREIDIQTGLSWRISSLPGDERYPAWSEDGRNLVYIYRQDEQWQLRLRPFGEPERVLVESDEPLLAPSWRPDGSLISYLRHGEKVSVEMLILSEPLLRRTLLDDRDIFLSPVAWSDRHNMVYAANGSIRRRDFNSWIPRNVPFRATLGHQPTAARTGLRELSRMNEPDRRWILRAARLYDGSSPTPRTNVDIVVDGGIVQAIEPSVPRPGEMLIDLGEVTVGPGLVDSDVALRGSADPKLGPWLLSLGITSVVVETRQPDETLHTWSGEKLPGPRVLPFDWHSGKATETLQLLGPTDKPASPAGMRYEDTRFSSRLAPASYLSGLASTSTPGLDALSRLRQAEYVREVRPAIPRFTTDLSLQAAAPTILLASRANRLPPGLGTIAELKALVAAGLTPFQAYRAAGANASISLGLGRQLGYIQKDGVADLVIYDKNPFQDIDNSLSVIAVVRNGRFHSVSGLLDRIDPSLTVE